MIVMHVTFPLVTIQTFNVDSKTLILALGKYAF